MNRSQDYGNLMKTTVMLGRLETEIFNRNFINKSKVLRQMQKDYIKTKGLK